MRPWERMSRTYRSMAALNLTPRTVGLLSYAVKSRPTVPWETEADVLCIRGQVHYGDEGPLRAGLAQAVLLRAVEDADLLSLTQCVDRLPRESRSAAAPPGETRCPSNFSNNSWSCGSP